MSYNTDQHFFGLYSEFYSTLGLIVNHPQGDNELSLMFSLCSVCVQIAVVSQDCMLFARSVQENIKYGCEDVSDEEMFRAARLASAHKFIEDLSDGYNTGLIPRLCIYQRESE